MRTRFKTLTVGVVLATAAMAGCSSTTAGSSGAVQNDATASASSSAASTSPAPSPDPVTPSPGPTGATASPTASPTDSPALLGGKSNPYCNSGLEYSCGEVGPGGGIVFLAVSTPFSLSNGYTTASCGNNNCQYMEAQTALLSPMPWCVGPGATTSVSPGTGAAIGTGYSNTQTMATKSDYCSSGAANAAIASTSGGYTDWFVPSYNEASALNDVLNNDLGSDYCWTSSQSNAKQAYTQPIQGSGNEQNFAKTYNISVCLARAF